MKKAVLSVVLALAISAVSAATKEITLPFRHLTFSYDEAAWEARTDIEQDPNYAIRMNGKPIVIGIKESRLPDNLETAKKILAKMKSDLSTEFSATESSGLDAIEIPAGWTCRAYEMQRNSDRSTGISRICVIVDTTDFDLMTIIVSSDHIDKDSTDRMNNFIASVKHLDAVSAPDLKTGAEAFQRGDYAAALAATKPIAEQGNSDAQDLLGLMYALGSKGLPQDYAQALMWFHKAAEQGDAHAQFGLGMMYANGQGVSKDYAQSMEWFRKSAVQGNAEAQNNLGTMYESGRGVQRDYAQAFRWYSKAADQGSADAQFNLGLAYQNGHGVAVDYAHALAWYRKSVAQGNVPSLGNLTTMYGMGQGVRRDPVAAYALVKVAGTRDSSYAKATARSGVLKTMKRAEIEAGEKLFRQMQERGVLVALDAHDQVAH